MVFSHSQDKQKPIHPSPQNANLSWGCRVEIVSKVTRNWLKNAKKNKYNTTTTTSFMQKGETHPKRANTTPLRVSKRKEVRRRKSAFPRTIDSNKWKGNVPLCRTPCRQCVCVCVCGGTFLNQPKCEFVTVNLINSINL